MHTYMEQISFQNSVGRVVFYGWVPMTPLGTNGNESTLVTIDNVIQIVITPALLSVSCQYYMSYY